MNIDLNKILSFSCIFIGLALFFLFLGSFIVKIIGAAAGLWLVSYGLALQGKTLMGAYFEIKNKFK